MDRELSACLVPLSDIKLPRASYLVHDAAQVVM
jgi:hypothetical protein